MIEPTEKLTVHSENGSFLSFRESVHHVKEEEDYYDKWDRVKYEREIAFDEERSLPELPYDNSYETLPFVKSETSSE